ncbi:MAG TPA: FAD-binding domain [Candidatus Krumholzibacteria bacterium]|nr:FAD-binding domain [Candidatus Krumholzibacteria bacterium]
MKIAINGAGIAGPALAYWLRRSGHEVLLIEEAASLRGGGYVIDFWGVGYDVAEKMGLIPDLRKLGYQVEEMRFVDDRNRRSGGFRTDVFNRMTGGRFTSLRRADVSATIYRTLEGVETLFGDSIAAIEEHDGGVHIAFDHAPPRDVDLVVGADGLHSRVRELVFGPQERFEVSLGYHVVAFEVGGYRPRDERVYVSYALPGRQISRFAMRDDRTLFLIVFRDEYLAGENPATDAARRVAVSRIFHGTGWECDRILAAMERADDVYFDRVSQIRMESWAKGRTVLIGDAAACVSLLAGEGTGLALAEAYVLAGELHRARGDYATAFARYQDRMLPFLRDKQQSAAKFASSFAPGSAFGIRFRNLVTRLLAVPAVANFFVGRDMRDNIELPDYGE